MPFSRPALTDLINRTRDDIVTRLPNPDLLRRSNAEVYAKALAGAAHGLYGYLDWLASQLIYDTAETDMLERWASIWGITRNAATAATGTVTFSGITGSFIPAGTALIAYDGIIYTTNADTALTATTATALVTASVAGISGLRATGQTFTLQAPISGIYSSVSAGAMTGGVDLENDDSLRARLLMRIKFPPQGGDKADYLTWAYAVPGVTRAWVYPLELGLGTVTVRFMMDNLYLNGIPLSGDVSTVATAINNARPVTAAVTVVAPVAVPLNFIITGLNPLNASVKAAVTQSLTDLIHREASPGGTLLLSHIREAISIAYGEFDHVLTSPTANVTNTTGNITTMGTITWA